MGTQSAVFGPAKYGILPELVPGPDLPRFNGVIQMTTFFALILGPWVGGILLGIYSQRLWIGGLVCVVIAVVGTATSLFVRRTPVAQPGAPFGWSSIAIGSETFALLKSDRALRNALWVYSLFWFVGALIPMLVNWLGKQQFGLNYADTSFMLATVSIGIAAGFVLAGKLSHGNVNFRLVRIGTWGLIVSLLLIALPGVGGTDMEDASVASSVAETGTAETFAKMPPNLLGYRGSQLALVAAGFFAGFFALPVQVFLQSRPPAHLKGRVIGAMNLINWIAIILAAVVFYPSCLKLLDWLELPKFCAFGITALMLLPVALFYHPQNEEL
jgi:MFS family permease